MQMLSDTLTKNIDFDTIIDNILLTSMGQTFLLHAAIYLKNNKDEKFRMHHNIKGFKIKNPEDYKLQYPSNMLKKLEEGPGCCTLKELEDKFTNDENITQLKELQAEFIVPVTFRGKLNGILVLGKNINERVFLEYKKNFLMQFLL